jgi:hypothetical protein
MRKATARRFTRKKEMLRITMSVSGEGATKYFDAALAKSKYSGSGQWGGKGAERLGQQGMLAVRTDQQLTDRFEAWELPPWQDNPALQQLLASFAAILPLRRASELHDGKIGAARRFEAKSSTT